MSKDFSTPKKVYIVVIIPVLVKGEKWVISGLLLSRSELTLELRGCISTWNSLLTHKKYVPFFLKQIVTGNEKWIVYTNVEWKRSRNKWYEPPWITSKTSLHPNKVMLYIWWDGKGVLYYEFLLANQTINYKYCSQLKQWKAALNKNHLELVNRKHIIFYQDNARSHVSLGPVKNHYSQVGKFWFIRHIH